MSSKRPFCVFEDVRPILRVLQETGLGSKKQEQQPTQATEEPELTIYGVEGSQQ